MCPGGILHCKGAQLQETNSVAGDPDGALRELLRYNLKIYSSGFDAALFHVYYGSLLGKVSQIEGSELLH